MSTESSFTKLKVCARIFYIKTESNSNIIFCLSIFFLLKARLFNFQLGIELQINWACLTLLDSGEKKRNRTAPIMVICCRKKYENTQTFDKLAVKTYPVGWFYLSQCMNQTRWDGTMGSGCKSKDSDSVFVLLTLTEENVSFKVLYEMIILVFVMKRRLLTSLIRQNMFCFKIDRTYCIQHSLTHLGCLIRVHHHSYFLFCSAH